MFHPTLFQKDVTRKLYIYLLSEAHIQCDEAEGQYVEVNIKGLSQSAVRALYGTN